MLLLCYQKQKQKRKIGENQHEREKLDESLRVAEGKQKKL